MVVEPHDKGIEEDRSTPGDVAEEGGALDGCGLTGGGGGASGGVEHVGQPQGSTAGWVEDIAAEFLVVYPQYGGGFLRGGRVEEAVASSQTASLPDSGKAQVVDGSKETPQAVGLLLRDAEDLQAVLNEVPHVRCTANTLRL